MTDTKRFKVLLLGAAGTGKTTWCQRVSTGQFVAAYNPTPCVLIHLIPLRTTAGTVFFNCWDTPGQPSAVEPQPTAEPQPTESKGTDGTDGAALNEKDLQDADGAVIFLEKPHTVQEAEERADVVMITVKALRQASPNVEVVYCVHKCDTIPRANLSDREAADILNVLRQKLFELQRNNHIELMSSKQMSGLVNPLLWLARVLLRNEGLMLKEDIPINVAVSTTESANADANDEIATTAEMDAVFKAWSETCAQKGLSEEEAFLRFGEGTSSWDQAVNAVNIALADLTASEVRQLIQRASSSKEKV